MIILSCYKFIQRNSNQIRSPKNFKIYASIDGINWDTIDNKTNITYNSGVYTSPSLNLNKGYCYCGFVVNVLLGTGAQLLNFDEWELYGNE